MRLARAPRAIGAASYAVPGLCGLVGLALASIDVGGRSIWLDESATISIASQHGPALWRAIGRDGGNMSGFYLLCHLLIGWFGDGTTLVRLPSVLALGATAAIVAHLGTRLFDRRTGLYSGLVCAVSVPLVFWAQDARAYALMTAFVAASFAALVAWCETDRGRGHLAFVAWVASSLAALYCSYVALFALVAQLVVLVGYRAIARRFVLGAVLVAAGAVPLALAAVSRGTGQLDWLGRPGASTYSQLAVMLTSAGFPPNFRTGATTTVVACVTGALLVAGALGTSRALARSGARPARHLVVLAGWIVIPIVLVVAESYLAQPVFTPRNLLEVLPAISLALGALCARTRFGVVAVVVLLGLRLAVLVPTYGVSPEPWDQAARLVEHENVPGACIAFYPEDARMALGYYLGTSARDARAAPRPVWPDTPFTRTVPFVERYVAPSAATLDAIAASCPVLFLVASHDGSAHGTPSARAHARAFVSLERALGTRYARSSRHVLGYAAPILVARYSGDPR